MPVRDVKLEIDGKPIVLPHQLKEQQDAAGQDTSAWYCKANSFRSTIGPQPSRCYLLVTKKTLDQLEAAGDPHILSIFDGQILSADGKTIDRIVNVNGLITVRATCVTGGVPGDPDGVYLMELSDRRVLAASVQLNTDDNIRQYNPIAPDQGPDVNGNEAIKFWVPNLLEPIKLPPDTWLQMVQELWTACVHLGAQPDELPVPGSNSPPFEPDGVPYNFLFQRNTSAFEALNCVLERLELALKWDFDKDEYVLVHIGGSKERDNLETAINQTVDPSLYHADGFGGGGGLPKPDPARNNIPGIIQVSFHSRDWSYPALASSIDSAISDNYVALPTTQDCWPIHPSHVREYITDAPAAPTTARADTSLLLYDDMPAIYSDNPGFFQIPLNATELDVRGRERANRRMQRILGTQWLHYIFLGLPVKPANKGNGFDPSFNGNSGSLTAIAYYDLGTGLKTEVLSTDITRRDWSKNERQDLAAWFDSGCLVCDGTPCENLLPAEIARAEVPRNRFVWGEVESGFSETRCGTVKVLRGIRTFKTDEDGVTTTDCNEFSEITVTNSDETTRDLTIEAYDFVGTPPQKGQRVICIWHWMSKSWVIISSGLGFIYVALMERSGSVYQGILMEPFSGGGSLGKTIVVDCSPTTSYQPNWCAFRPIRPLVENEDGELEPDPTGVVPIGPLKQENCRPDNCQGGRHPEIVKAYPHPTQEKTWLFAYGDCQEEDSERQKWNGTTWRRSSAFCKGISIKLLIAP